MKLIASHRSPISSSYSFVSRASYSPIAMRRVVRPISVTGSTMERMKYDPDSATKNRISSTMPNTSSVSTVICRVTGRSEVT